MNDDDVLSAIKTYDMKIKRYLDSEKIKKLIEYITKEPKVDNYLLGYKYPYISCEILKSNCNYILQRFILDEEKYYKEFFYLNDMVENMRINSLKLEKTLKEIQIITDDIKNNADKLTNIINIENNKIDKKIVKEVDNIITNKEKKDEKSSLLDKTKEEKKEKINSEIYIENKVIKEDIKQKELGIKNGNIEKQEDNKFGDCIKEIEKNELLDNNETGEKKDIIKAEKNKNINEKEIKNNKDNNEYLDLLLEFVMNDKLELNDILSNYFSEVLLNLLKYHPYQIYEYIYTKRKEVLKKILFRSYQKPFALLSEKLLDIEYLSRIIFVDKQLVEKLISENTSYRNDIIKELLMSIDLNGLKLDNIYISDFSYIENIFSSIIELIKGKNKVIEVFNNKNLSAYFYDILSTKIYEEIDKNNYDNFNKRYNIYCLFIKIIYEIAKIVSKNSPKYLPSEKDFERVKDKKCQYFKDYIIAAFEIILKYNFRPKSSNILGILNVYIIDFIINMFGIMVNIPKEFDNILLNNNFCEKSLEFFFNYQWNNIYHNKFFEFFCLYLKNESNHSEITNCFFNKIKIQDLFCNFLENKNDNDNNNIKIPKLKYELKSGNKIKSGIYGHIIFLVYKIQTYSGLETFSENEIKNMDIKNLGEFKFLKVNQLFSFLRKKNVINISLKLKNILFNDKRWCTMFKNIAFPIIKRYEIQLFKREFNKMVYDKKLSEMNKKKNALINSNNNIKENNNKKENIEQTKNINNKIKNNVNDKAINNKTDIIIKNKNNEDNTKIDEIYNDVNYWKINYNFDIKLYNNNQNDEEEELLNISKSLEQKEICNNMKNKNKNCNIEMINKEIKIINEIKNETNNKIDKEILSSHTDQNNIDNNLKNQKTNIKLKEIKDKKEENYEVKKIFKIIKMMILLYLMRLITKK